MQNGVFFFNVYKGASFAFLSLLAEEGEIGDLEVDSEASLFSEPLNGHEGRATGLISFSRIHLEKLIVVPSILWNLDVHYHAHKSSPLVPVLVQMNTVQALRSI